MKSSTLVCAVLLIGLIGACKTETEMVVEPKSPTSETKPVANSISIADVKSAFEKAELPLHRLVIYTEDTDPNSLLNRPNQYIGKLSFAHEKVSDAEFGAQSSTVEIFKTKEDLEKRKKYIEAVTQSVSPLAQYIYEHKNALLRLSHKVKPKEAKKYELALKSL